jgi:hypothetical protein
MNVDLEIVSRSKLDGIEKAVQERAHALFCGPVRKGIFLLSLECNRYPKDADAGIVELCTTVDALGDSDRRLWDRALRRTFDVGYRIASGSRAVHVGLRAETLRRVTRLGATVAFTCYRDDIGEPDGPANGRQPARRVAIRTSQVAGSRR